MTEIDISSEEWRVYTYPNGDTFKVPEPLTLFVLSDERGATHRIIDKDGITHRPERGWTGISWLPRKGERAFVA